VQDYSVAGLNAETRPGWSEQRWWSTVANCTASPHYVRADVVFCSDVTSSRLCYTKLVSKHHHHQQQQQQQHLSKLAAVDQTDGCVHSID